MAVALASLIAERPASAQLQGTQFYGFPLPSTNVSAIDQYNNIFLGTYLGGDGGYASVLPNGNLFFGFGDPNLGPYAPQAATRSSASTITFPAGTNGGGNSVAVVQPAGGTQLAYQHYFRIDPSTQGSNTSTYNTAPFFQIISPSGPGAQTAINTNNALGARYWLKKGFSYNGSFYIFANFATNNGTAVVMEDTILIRVSNPTAPPSSWIYDYLNVGIFQPQGQSNYATGVAAPCTFGTEAYVSGGYLYFYGTHNFSPNNTSIDLNQDFIVYVAAIPLSKITAPAWGSNANLAQSIVYLSKDGVTWVPGMYDPNATTTGAGGGPNGASPVHTSNYYVVGDQDSFSWGSYSIRYNSTKGYYQAVWSYDKYTDRWGMPPISQRSAATLQKGNSIWIGTSNSAFGPFTNNVTQIASFPSTGFDPNTSGIINGYATREVAAFESSDSQVYLNFTQNSTVRSDIFLPGNQGLYTVSAMVVPNPLP
jgi:hypothetical protein